MTTRPDYKIVYAALFAAVLVPWGLRIGNGFWIDETLAVWAASEGFFSALERSWEFQGQSPLYYGLLSLWMKVVGSQEALLRLPSALLVAAGCYYVARMGTLLGDAKLGWFAAIVFAASPAAVISAVSVRPYGLALAAAIASCAYWLASVKEGRKRDTALSLFFALVAFYAHYLYGGIVLFQLLFTPQSRHHMRKLALFFVLFFVACLPALSHLSYLQARSAEISLSGEPSIAALALILFNPVLTLLVALASLLHDGLRPRTGKAAAAPPLSYPPLSYPCIPHRMLLFFYAAPVIALFFLAWVRDQSTLFQQHYLFWSTPALVLLLAGFLRRRGLVALIIFVAAILAMNPAKRFPAEDWRAVTSALIESRESFGERETPPLLLYHGLIESTLPHWVASKDLKAQYLRAPLIVYGVAEEAHVLPYHPGLPAYDAYYLENIIPALGESLYVDVIGTDVILIEGVPASEHVNRKLGEMGYEPLTTQQFRDTWLRRYERTNEPNAR